MEAKEKCLWMHKISLETCRRNITLAASVRKSWGAGESISKSTSSSFVTNRRLVPKDVHDLIPETWEYVTLHGKKDFADMIGMIQLRILK